MVVGTDLISTFNGDDNNQDLFIALKNYSTTEGVFKEKTLSAYWSAMVFSYLRVTNAGNRLLTPFPLTWLYETGFLPLLKIKSKARTKLIVKPDQRCAPPTTGPRIGKGIV